MRQPQIVLYETMRKELFLWDKSLKLDVLKLIVVLSIQGITWAAKNKNCVVIFNHNLLNSNPVVCMF